MSLQELNSLDKTQLETLLTRCCGSTSWVRRMSLLFPVKNEGQLFDNAKNTWYSCDENDWLEAFSHHPKIGDMASLKAKFADTANWAAGEQAAVTHSSYETLQDLAEANQLYEERFGFIFIVCATGKSAEEMLQLLHARLGNQKEKEIKIAMQEQFKITTIRLEKLLQS